MKAAPLLLVATLVIGAAAGAVWFALRDAETSPEDGANPPDVPVKQNAPVKKSGTPKPAPAPLGVEGPGDPPPAAPKPAPRAPAEKEPPIPEPTAEPQPGAGARFQFAGWEKIVASIDWTQIGIACRKARVAHRDVYRRLERGADVGAVMHPTVNATYAVVNLASEMGRDVMKPEPGRMPHPPAGFPLSHPVFEANAMAATLDAWGRPLTEAQQRALQPLYDARVEEWRQNHDSSMASPWPFDGLVAIMKSRLAFQTKLETILEPRQVDALWAPETKGRARLDLFCAAVQWQDELMLVTIREGDDPEKQLAGVLRGALFIWRKVGPEFEEAVSAWYRSRPEAWRKGVVGPASRIGFVSEAEIVAGAEAAAELVRTVAVKGWRDPKLSPMTPPFRSAIVLSHVLR